MLNTAFQKLIFLIQDHNRLCVINMYMQEITRKEIEPCFALAFTVLTEKQQVIVRAKVQKFYNQCQEFEFNKSLQK